MIVYLDNAASTALDPRVLEEMLPYLSQHYGNPSSLHAFGRKNKAVIEFSRKKIAQLLGCHPGELFFTAGGTEADNIVLLQSQEFLGVKNFVSSRIEHHAVLHTLEYLEKSGKAKVHWLENDEKGQIDLVQLEKILQQNTHCLVSLMHVNNEIGNINPIEEVAVLCERYKAYFHSDMVQSIGHIPINLKETGLSWAAASAHKFYGPKGIGLLYKSKDIATQAFRHGGNQEKGLISGTENVAAIVGMAKALELAVNEMEASKKHISALKSYFIDRLKELPDITFNGISDDLELSKYSVINISLPDSEKTEMLLFNLDLEGIYVSGGSACGSGALKGSHVLEALGKNDRKSSIRFSLSKETTQEELDYTLTAIKSILD